MPKVVAASLLNRLDEALASWQQCDANTSFCLKPRVLEALAGGRSNRSFIVQCAAQNFVLRINHLHPAKLGINRQAEAAILNALSPLNIAPQLRYSCPKYSFSVFEYISGRVWQERDFLQPAQRHRLKRVVAQYRACTLALTPFDYVAYLENYWQQFQCQRPVRARLMARNWYAFVKRLRQYQRRNPRQHLVHHDLVPGNIIDNDEGLKIIDWEYAGLGFSALDDAAIHRSFRPCAVLKVPIQKRRLQSGYHDASEIKGSIISQIRFWLDFLWWQIR